MADAQPPPEHIVRARHELRDLSPKHIAYFAGSLALTIAIVFWVSSALMHYYYDVQQRSQPPQSPLSFNQPPMPEPRLIIEPGEEMAELQETQDAILDSYAWVDKERGIARIPIKRAMEILAKKNLPTRTKKEEKHNETRTEERNKTRR